MKNLILVFSLIIVTNSCSQSDENKQIENSIYGTWQLSDRTANNVDGTPNDWEQVENGYKITFNEDFSYNSEIYPNDCNEISSSTYITQSEEEINILEIIIICNNQSETFKSKYSYTFENSTHLILNPIEPVCPEGCVFKYKKIE